MTGVDENERVLVNTIPYKYDFKKQQNTKVGVSSNTCERSFKANILSKQYSKTPAELSYGNSGTSRASLDILYALDDGQVKAGLDISAPGAPSSG